MVMSSLEPQLRALLEMDENHILRITAWQANQADKVNLIEGASWMRTGFESSIVDDSDDVAGVGSERMAWGIWWSCSWVEVVCGSTQTISLSMPGAHVCAVSPLSPALDWLAEISAPIDPSALLTPDDPETVINGKNGDAMFRRNWQIWWEEAKTTDTGDWMIIHDVDGIEGLVVI
jgi:hypothetical protein